MKRGPYLFTQWRRHKKGGTEHCYIWCQWETEKGTDGVARSVSRHGFYPAVNLVLQAAEKRTGTKIDPDSVPWGRLAFS